MSAVGVRADIERSSAEVHCWNHQMWNPFNAEAIECHSHSPPALKLVVFRYCKGVFLGDACGVASSLDSSAAQRSHGRAFQSRRSLTGRGGSACSCRWVKTILRERLSFLDSRRGL